MQLMNIRKLTNILTSCCPKCPSFTISISKHQTDQDQSKFTKFYNYLPIPVFSRVAIEEATKSSQILWLSTRGFEPVQYYKHGNRKANSIENCKYNCLQNDSKLQVNL